MGKKSGSKASLFLMELIVAILIFSVASAVCVQLFAKARLLNQKTDALNLALSCTQSAAEQLRGTDGSAETIAALYPDAEQQGASFAVGFDQDGNPCAVPQSACRLEITLSGNGQTRQADLACYDEQNAQPVYQLQLRFHIPIIPGQEEVS